MAGVDIVAYLTNDSIADYYAEGAIVVGRWAGTGAAELGLANTVEHDDLRAVLAGIEPVSGMPLGDAGPRTRAGFDLTFSAPKGVSLLAALGGPEISAEVSAAQRHAVDEALGYLERRATSARRGHGGARLEATTGLIGAAFEHKVSRALDPQVHTHVVVANVVHGEDGRWSAIDGRNLYAHAKTAGTLYQAALRAELTRRLDLCWQRPHKGMAEPAGISAPALAEFSRRRTEITAALDERGASSQAAGRVATLLTRPAKPAAVDVVELRHRWQERAAERGLDAAAIGGLCGPGRDPALMREEWAAEGRRLLSPRGLTEHASAFDRRALLMALAERAIDGADVAVLEDVATIVLHSPGAVVLGSPEGASGDDVARFSTAELVGVEAAVVAGALERAGAGVGLADPGAVAAALAERPALADEQVALVRGLTGSGRGVECVIGPAGTGKTFALDAARASWESSGVAVVGAAVSGRAAAGLASGTGIASTTLWKLLDDLERPGPGGGLRPGTVVVIDEAAMVGTRDLARLGAHASAAGAKLVLVGDPRQLPEIGAGGTFAAIARRAGARELTENRRQSGAWERDALGALRSGAVRAAVLAYDDHDRVVLAPTAPDARAAMVERWLAAHRAGEDAVMFCARRTDVADLNARARAALHAAGCLASTEVIVGDQPLAAGDEVMAQRTRHRQGLFNGTRATVIGVDPGHQRLDLRLADGGERTITVEEAQRARLGLGYAMTAHKGQGATVDRAFLLGGDALYREAGYTGMSRARLGTDLFVVEGAPERAERAEHAHGSDVDKVRPPLDQLVDVLSRSRAQHLALEQAVGLPPPGTNLARLEDERQRLAKRLDADRQHQAQRLAAERQAQVPPLPAVSEAQARRLHAEGRALSQQPAAGTEGRPLQRPLDVDVERHNFAPPLDPGPQRSLDVACADPGRTGVSRLTPTEPPGCNGPGADRQQAAVEPTERSPERPTTGAPERWPNANARLAQRHDAVLGAIDARRDLLARAALAVPRPHLVAALGPPPTDGPGRAEWARGARAAECYRDRWGVADPVVALGERPRQPERVREWQQADRALQRAQRSLGLDRGRSTNRNRDAIRHGSLDPDRGLDRTRDTDRARGSDRVRTTDRGRGTDRGRDADQDRSLDEGREGRRRRDPDRGLGWDR